MMEIYRYVQERFTVKSMYSMKNAMHAEEVERRDEVRFVAAKMAERRSNRLAFIRLHLELRNYTAIRDQACGKGTPRVLARLSLEK